MHISLGLTILLLSLSAIHAIAYASTGVSFVKRVIDPAPPKLIWAKGTGDFNGDGLADIVIAGLGTIIIYENPGRADGVWKKHIIYDGDQAGFEGCAVGDIDGDGDADIIVGAYYTHTVFCLENPGKPGTDWIMHNLGGPKTDATYLADFDGDGRLDIITRASALWSGGVGREVYLWKQGNNPFNPVDWQRTRKEVGGGEHCAIGDVDGDGRIDVIASNTWIRNDGTAKLAGWRLYAFTNGWTHECAYPFLADMNNDGRQDIVLTPTEKAGQFYKTAWYEAPGDRTAPNWKEHVVENAIECITHGLGVYDFNGDGWMDIFTAEMEQSTDPDEVRVYLSNGSGDSWTKEVLSVRGSHWCQFFDLENDGDIDIFGANHGGSGPTRAEIWENLSGPAPPSGSYRYMLLDSTRSLPRTFGLAMGDLTGDGFGDIVAGNYFYRNPGGDMSGMWARTQFRDGLDTDVLLIVDIDGDQFGDVIAEWLPGIFWLESLSPNGSSWTVRRKIGEIPAGPHGHSAQGYALAQVVPGGKHEILLASRGVYYFQVPDDPLASDWKRTRVAESTNSEEGIGTGDIDGDGDIDLCGSIDKDAQPNVIVWYENPGNGEADWRNFEVGTVSKYADREYLCDLDGDGRLDIVVSAANGNDDGVYWFQAPPEPHATWRKCVVVKQPLCNSMDIADVDSDGDADIIVGQHGGDMKLQFFLNNGRGEFMERVIDTGRESHLGARVADLDGDGDLEIVSTCWTGYQMLHLWRCDK